MTAQLLYGTQIASQIKKNLKNKLEQYRKKGHRQPGLHVFLVGEDPASKLYVENKKNACEEIGIDGKVLYLPDNIQKNALIGLIEQSNHDPNCDGILVQLPLPDNIPTDLIAEHIAIDKDVDGFHPYNLGRLVLAHPVFKPCTPAGILILLEQIPLKLRGIKATVIGISNIVGKPMILELLNQDATVTACHRFTNDLAQYLEDADLVISATGVPELIKGAWIKKGSVVIDVGMHRLANGNLIGDIEFEAAAQKASFITPVPGGVGPMTVAMLMHNTILAYEKHLSLHQEYADEKMV